MPKKTLNIKVEDQKKLVKDIEQELGVTLIAKNATDDVDGYINTIGDNKVEVILYEEEKLADYRELSYRGNVTALGDKSNRRVKNVPKDKLDNLEDKIKIKEVKDLMKGRGIDI